MLSFRLQTSAHHLLRPRLLEQLPDSPGYAVWLEAPYGYGKSVLAGQWAALLETQGWRVLWLAVGGQALRGLVARRLGLPPSAPWGAVLDAVWESPTLLVLEDLETLPEGSDLSPLLRDLRGLVLLASRTPIASPEVPRLLTEGRLIRLQGDDLAFSEAEAAALFGDAEHGRRMLERTSGWPLPLHFAALTGDLPESTALVEGLRASLDAAAWKETLLLAALPYLPAEAISPATEDLARNGFVQKIEAGYRLHALVAAAVLHAHTGAVRRAVLESAARLPPESRGDALERCGLYAALGELLEVSGGMLAHQAPDVVLRWDALAPGPRGVVRRSLVGWALCSLGEVQRGVDILLGAARLPGLSPDDALDCYRKVVWFLADTGDPAAVRAVEAAAAPLMERADPEIAGAFLNNLFRVHFNSGAWEQAAATLRRALGRYPPGSPKRAISQGNLAVVRWHHRGDVDALRLWRARALEVNRVHNPSNVPGDHLQLGEVALLLGERAEALAHCRAARAAAQASPRWALEAEALGAQLEGDAARFPRLLARAEAWQDAALVSRVLFFWANTLLEQSPLEQSEARAALTVLEGRQGFWVGVARALALARLGGSGALAALGEAPPPTRLMEERLHWHAAHYRVTRHPSALDALLELSLARERLLPSLVPLGELPRARPELSLAYPLETVLASGWREAVRLRLEKIPALELTLLGGFDVRVLGKPVVLTDRQRQILALACLGLSRERMAEAMWPEADPKKQRNNLAVQFTLLRRTLEPWGVATYLFEDGLRRVRSDYAELREALANTDPEALLAQYREPFAPGVELAEVHTEREQLREAVVAALHQAACAAEPDRASAYLTRVMDLEPLHEQALARFVALLVRRGRRREAAKRFESFRARLEEEVGLEPLPETSAALREP